jgi:hypothetical protein
MAFTDWTFLGVYWLWWAAAAAVMLLAWSLTPMRLPGKGPRRGESSAILDIRSLLWVYPAADVVRLLREQPGLRTYELDLARGVARVAFDRRVTSAARLQDFVNSCAHHCRGDRAGAHSCPTTLNDD